MLKGLREKPTSGELNFETACTCMLSFSSLSDLRGRGKGRGWGEEGEGRRGVGEGNAGYGR